MIWDGLYFVLVFLRSSPSGLLDRVSFGDDPRLVKPSPEVLGESDIGTLDIVVELFELEPDDNIESEGEVDVTGLREDRPSFVSEHPADEEIITIFRHFFLVLGFYQLPERQELLHWEMTN